MFNLSKRLGVLAKAR